MPDTGATLNIPTTGNPLSLSDFYGTQDVAFRNVSFSLYKSTNGNSSGVGLSTASSTAAPTSFSTTTRQRFYQPVFRAGTNFITSLTFGLGYNEDCSTQTDTIVFYGGTTSSNVTSAQFTDGIPSTVTKVEDIPTRLPLMPMVVYQASNILAVSTTLVSCRCKHPT